MQRDSAPVQPSIALRPSRRQRGRARGRLHALHACQCPQHAFQHAWRLQVVPRPARKASRLRPSHRPEYPREFPRQVAQHRDSACAPQRRATRHPSRLRDLLRAHRRARAAALAWLDPRWCRVRARKSLPSDQGVARDLQGSPSMPTLRRVMLRVNRDHELRENRARHPRVLCRRYSPHKGKARRNSEGLAQKRACASIPRTTTLPSSRSRAAL